MNRITKYRVYDKFNRKMYNWPIDLTYYLNTDGKTAPDFELMQFTGLIDKRRKEIYEGDIVRIENWRHYDYGEKFGQKIDKTPMNTAIGVITWDNSGSGGYWLTIKGELTKYIWNHVWSKDRKGNPAYSVEPEVIGNIFENPELLK